MAGVKSGRFATIVPNKVAPNQLGVPMMPGNNFHEDPIMRGTLKKAHHFDINGSAFLMNDIKDFQTPSGDTYNMSWGEKPKELGRSSTAPAQLEGTNADPATASSSAAASPWLQNELVLKYNAYFKEPVFDSADERSRVRKVMMTYHVSDHTLMVRELFQDNSGMPHGTMIRRHRIPKDGTNGQEFITYQDLIPSESVTIYGKVFKVIGCDNATREFCMQQGAELPPNEEFPLAEDEYGQKLEKRKGDLFRNRRLLPSQMADDKRFWEQSKGAAVGVPSSYQVRMAQQYFKNDGKRLTFIALFDDRASIAGDLRVMSVHLYLADDTFEVVEQRQANSGREHTAKLLSRQRLPKPLQQEAGWFEQPSPLAGTFTNQVQNTTFGVMLTDNYLTPEDISIGMTLNVYGKPLLLYDANPYTRDFYSKEIGRELDPPMDVSSYTDQPKARRPRPPPHDGIGAEQDALQNWRYLIPRAPKKDYEKMKRLEKVNIVFNAVFSPNQNMPKTDLGRKFIVTFFLSDDTTAIDEVGVRNSGFTGGRFLARAPLKKQLPGNKVAPIVLEDFQEGNSLTICGKTFLLLGCDERSRKIIQGIEVEAGTDDIKGLICHFRETLQNKYISVTEAFRAVCSNKNGAITVDEIVFYFDRVNRPIARNDAKVILHKYDLNGDGKIDMGEFVKLMQPDPFGSNLDEAVNSIKGVTLTDQDTFQAKNSPRFDAMEMDVRLANQQKQVLRMFRDKMYQRRMHTNDVFRLMNGAQPDSLLTPAEFEKGCKDILHLILSSEEMQVLMSAFFADGQDCTLPQFTTVLEGVGEFLPALATHYVAAPRSGPPGAPSRYRPEMWTSATIHNQASKQV